MPSSASQGAAVTAAYMEYWIKNIVTIVKSGWARIKGFGSAVGETLGSAFGTFASEAKWSDWATLLTPGGALGKVIAGKITGKDNAFTKAIDAGADGWQRGMEEMELDFEEFEKEIEARAKRLGTRLDAAFKLDRNLKKAAISTSARNVAISTAARNAAGVDLFGDSMRAPQIRNDLILGGSNAASKLVAFGPTLQSEQKKTNQLLAQVVENTSKTAENTKENPGDETEVYDG
jgi:hypothetical protein